MPAYVRWGRGHILDTPVAGNQRKEAPGPYQWTPEDMERGTVRWRGA